MEFPPNCLFLWTLVFNEFVYNDTRHLQSSLGSARASVSLRQHASAFESDLIPEKLALVTALIFCCLLVS